MTSRIKKLPEILINRIAAGEVVERPASALKEVMENSIDADADNIVVELIHGGISQIKVIDNGSGIVCDDMPLALDRHATSKIQTDEDLYTITTLGFRGEGLASIASVSNFSLSSKLVDSEMGYKIISKFGEIGDVIPSALNQGTVVEINDLYHNIPVRKKFLKTETTEYGHCRGVFERIALSHPQISFTLKHNGKVVYDLPKQSLIDRIGLMFGDEYTKHAIEVFETQVNGEALTGYVYHPNSVNASKSIQFSYLNARFIRDRVVQNAIKQSFSGVLHGDSQPQYVLFLQLNPKEVDVNVHPTKSEVRFREVGRVHSFISSSIKKALTASSVLRKEDDSLTKVAAMGLNPSNSSSTTLDNRYLNANTALNSDARFTPRSSFSNSSYAGYEKPRDNSSLVRKWLDNDTLNGEAMPRTNNEKPIITPDLFMVESNTDVPLSKSILSNETYPPLGFALAKLHGVYILAQAKDGLVIVDMHAAHERITLEKLKQDLEKSHHIASEMLLLPINLEIDEVLIETVNTHLADFLALGFEIELLDTTTLVIKSHPRLLQSNNIGNLVLNLLNEFNHYGQSDALKSHQEDILSEMACHSALRANDEISIEQMNALLRQIEETTFGGFCNHGRPTWFLFSMKELNTLFLRGR